MNVKEFPERVIVGMIWEGTFRQAARGKIHDVIQEMLLRKQEVDCKVNASQFFGISIHDRIDGFTHIAGWEVEEVIEVPEGMMTHILPKGTYVIRDHRKEENIGISYINLFAEIRDHDLIPVGPENSDSFDELPIKVEIHPAELLLKQMAAFSIQIPVK